MLAWVLGVYVSLGAAIWIWLYSAFIAADRRIRRFEDLDPSAPAGWPALSIIVAARDEAGTIADAATSLLRIDYPDVEFVFVNDRSTDETGEIIDSLARKDSRVRPVHVDELPEGWLGKVHALYKGTAIARGQWLLYTDADVHFSPDSVMRAVAHAEAERLDHLAILPQLRCGTFMFNVVLAAFGLMFYAFTGLAGAIAPKSRAFGVGAFNLIRKSAYDRSEGFGWLRMEVGDDVALGMAIKRAGGRAELARARQDVSVMWYPDAPSMMKGLRKNMFGTSTGYSYPLAAGLAVFLALFAITPAMALIAALYLHPLFYAVPAVIFALLLITGLRGAERYGASRWPPLLSPLGYLLMAWVTVDSAFYCLCHGGIEWRGTLYPVDKLRAGSRMRV